MYSLELAHVTDAFKKGCQLATEASDCSETQTDSGRDTDQLLNTFQVFDHNNITDVV